MSPEVKIKRLVFYSVGYNSWKAQTSIGPIEIEWQPTGEGYKVLHCRALVSKQRQRIDTIDEAKEIAQKFFDRAITGALEDFHG